MRVWRSGGPHLPVKHLSQYDTAILKDSKAPSLNAATSGAGYIHNLRACESQLAAIYAACVSAYPDFGISPADFKEGVSRAIEKYLIKFGSKQGNPSPADIGVFIGELQSLDLFLALGCARGNERAWWEFDRNYRTFIERLARHLVGNRVAADEAIDFVYAELFGTNTSGGIRQSKFKTYTGRGTLRGWLRAVVWHAVVDLYRQRNEEIPLDQCPELDKDGREISVRRPLLLTAETGILDEIVRKRYRAATIAALDESLGKLEPHETLLLMYYHIDGLKLREIARIIENPASPMRRWFKRSSSGDSRKKSERVHESTVMRWLEKAYRKVSQTFCAELQHKHGLKTAEIELCMAIATEDLGEAVRIKAPMATFDQTQDAADAKSNV